MAKTVVGLFESTSKAEQVKQELINEGYSSGQLSVIAADGGNVSGGTTGSSGAGYGDSSRQGSGEGVGARIEHFFKSLMGGDDEVHQHYASGVNQGGALLAVRTEDEDADEVAQWLNDRGARNIDRNAHSVESGSRGTREEFANRRDAGDGRDVNGRAKQAIPVIEEELQVGKRTVDRGGVRVYSHTTEQPAEADVTLRDESINVERRPVDRAATAADFAAASGKTIEMRAQGEEAVVGKSSRVVEEVVLNKQVSERTEQVKDKVRNTDVEVENISGNADTQANADRDAAYTGRKAVSGDKDAYTDQDAAYRDRSGTAGR